MLIKNLLRSVFIIILMLTISFNARSSSIKLIAPVANITTPINEDSLRVLQMQQRLKEIQAMDLQDLTPVEKKNLRKELLHMKKEARSVTGVYIPIGSLLLIIILLLIILR